MSYCANCRQEFREDQIYPISRVNGESLILCASCCIKTNNYPDGYCKSRNILTGKEILLKEEYRGVPWLDPAYETYHSM